MRIYRWYRKLLVLEQELGPELAPARYSRQSSGFFLDHFHGHPRDGGRKAAVYMVREKPARFRRRPETVHNLAS